MENMKSRLTVKPHPQIEINITPESLAYAIAERSTAGKFYP